MSANRLLKNEQITLMRLAAATDVVEIKVHQRALKKVGRKLDTLPYAHRPYCPSKSRPIERRAALSVWENEGGHVIGLDNDMLLTSV